MGLQQYQDAAVGGKDSTDASIELRLRENACRKSLAPIFAAPSFVPADFFGYLAARQLFRRRKKGGPLTAWLL
jgi:hypothetical protein